MDVCEVNEGTVAIRGFGWRSKRRYRRERHLRFSSPLRSSSDPVYAIFLELKLSEDVRSLAEQGWRSVLQIQQESRHLGHPTRLRASLSLLRTTLHFWTGNSRRVATNEKKNRVAGRVGGGITLWVEGPWKLEGVRAMGPLNHQKLHLFYDTVTLTFNILEELVYLLAGRFCVMSLDVWVFMRPWMHQTSIPNGD